MSNQTVFQLSALSQNDPQTADGSKLSATILDFVGGSLRNGSSSADTDVSLPIPPAENKTPPATPSWFLIPDGDIGKCYFSIQINGPSSYKNCVITVNAEDVIKWTNISKNNGSPINQIYKKGDNGIFGFAQNGPNGPIYTVTAGVANPQVNPG